jgi:hypothetical protein
VKWFTFLNGDALWVEILTGNRAFSEAASTLQFWTLKTKIAQQTPTELMHPKKKGDASIPFATILVSIAFLSVFDLLF